MTAAENQNSNSHNTPSYAEAEKDARATKDKRSRETILLTIELGRVKKSKQEKRR